MQTLAERLQWLWAERNLMIKQDQPRARLLDQQINDLIALICDLGIADLATKGRDQNRGA